MKWQKVVTALEAEARELQDHANAAATQPGMKAAMHKWDTLAGVARMLAKAIRHGLA